MQRLPGIVSIIVSASTALVILAIAITPFLTPAWVAFEQGRSEAAAWTGYSETDLRTATDSILSDLIVGPPSFDVTVGGEPVLSAAERSHMRDVRAVFSDFYLVAGFALVILVVTLLAAGRTASWSRARFFRAMRAGGMALGIGVVLAGVIAAVAFDAAFEVFHRLFFAAGTYNFDPRTDRLVQLFPDTFWSETTIAVGIVTVGFALAAIYQATRRLRVIQSTERALTAGDAT